MGGPAAPTAGPPTSRLRCPQGFRGRQPTIEAAGRARRIPGVRANAGGGGPSQPEVLRRAGPPAAGDRNDLQTGMVAPVLGNSRDPETKTEVSYTSVYKRVKLLTKVINHIY